MHRHAAQHIILCPAKSVAVTEGGVGAFRETLQVHVSGGHLNTP